MSNKELFRFFVCILLTYIVWHFIEKGIKFYGY